MRGLGTFLIVIGLIWVVFAFSMDTTVEVPSQTFGEGEYAVTTPSQRINNLGLMNDKQNYIIGAGLTLLIGVLLYVLGAEKEENSNNIQILKTSNKKTSAYKVKNIKFEDAKTYLLKQYEPLGYKVSLDIPNILKLSDNNTYVQLKYNKSTNDLTLETFNAEIPNITKELTVPQNSTDRLKKLSDMYEKGFITKEEFIEQKNVLLKKS